MKFLIAEITSDDLKEICKEVIETEKYNLQTVINAYDINKSAEDLKEMFLKASLKVSKK